LYFKTHVQGIIIIKQFNNVVSFVFRQNYKRNSVLLMLHFGLNSSEKPQKLLYHAQPLTDTILPRISINYVLCLTEDLIHFWT